MRRLTAKLCHGGGRRPREPLGTAAPFVRVLAWAVASLTSLTVLVLTLVYWQRPTLAVARALGAVIAIGVMAFLGLRYVAGTLRHDDLTLRVVKPSRR